MGRPSEARGPLLVLATGLAPKTWIMIGAVPVSIATIIGGIAWILPIPDGEDEDQP